MKKVGKKLIALVGPVMFLLGPGQMVAHADGYSYSTTLEVCQDTASVTNCATPTSQNGTALNAGDDVTVDFDLTTSDAQHDWPAPGGVRPENGAVFRVALANNSDPLACYNSRIAQNSPLVRTGGAGILEGALASQEPATHTAEPVVGGMLLPLSTTIENGKTAAGTVSGTRVTANASGSFLVEATLPATLPTTVGATKTAKICVQSPELYGDRGNVIVDIDNDGNYEPSERTGVGVHCDPAAIVGSTCTTVAPVQSTDPMCYPWCETYNSTPRFSAELVIATT